MPETSYSDLDVGSREEFEAALSDLLEEARTSGVEVEGAYEARSAEDATLRIELGETTDGGYRTASDPGGDRTPNDVGSVDVTARTSLVQVLTGLPVDGGERTCECSACGAELLGGSPVTVYCRKPHEGFRWDVHRAYCRDCGVDALDAPGFGRTDVLVKASLVDAMYTTARQSSLVLDRVRIADYSPPSEGSV